jgi:hypothetical protein
MAEDNIDKALPNEPRKEFNIPGEEEIQETLVEEVKAEQELPDDVEVQENEDGSVDINLDPQAASPEGGDEHYANLAEFLPDDVLSSLASDLNSRYMDYTSSRKDWEKTYTQGLDLLGFKYDNRTEPFSGASGATHPVLAEAVTQFQALAYKELLPADGPSKNSNFRSINSRKNSTSSKSKRFYELSNYGSDERI